VARCSTSAPSGSRAAKTRRLASQSGRECLAFLEIVNLPVRSKTSRCLGSR
jgi:hypothetical protein